MNSSSLTPSAPERATEYRDYVAGSRAVYRKYLRPAADRAAGAYQKYVRPAVARAAAAAATAAYQKYVIEPTTAQAVEPSGAERAAAAAAESAAAYRKYVTEAAGESATYRL